MRETASLLRIWVVFLRRPTEERYGLEVGMAANVGPGVLYPRLRQMVDAGYLTVRDDDDAGRIYYRLTTDGYLAGQAALGPFQIVGTDESGPIVETVEPQR